MYYRVSDNLYYLEETIKQKSRKVTNKAYNKEFFTESNITLLIQNHPWADLFKALRQSNPKLYVKIRQELRTKLEDYFVGHFGEFLRLPNKDDLPTEEELNESELGRIAMMNDSDIACHLAKIIVEYYKEEALIIDHKFQKYISNYMRYERIKLYILQHFFIEFCLFGLLVPKKQP